MMPTLFGVPFYPFGAPLHPEKIHLSTDETLQDIILKYWEQRATIEEEEIIKEYVLYYVAAPLFNFQFESGKEKQKFENLKLNDMLDALLDAGIDPL